MRTASFSGKLDADGNELLGRADAVHTRGVDVPLPESSRALVWALYRLNAHSGGSSVVAAARSVFRAAAQTRLGNELRRWRLAPLEFRLLNATDTSALVVFAQRHLEVPVPFLKRQLRLRWHQAGAAAGAFDVRGRLCGFAYFDDFRQEGLQLDGWWIRSLFVAPRARRLGVASQLVGLLCTRAKELGVTCLRADVPASNRASLNMFERASFVPSEPSVVERVTREWERNGVYDQWAVLENRL